MTSAHEIREAQRVTWAGLSASWDKWDEVITHQLAPVGAAIIERLDVQDGSRILDVASGTGEPGLTLARTSPGSSVVLTDLVPEMLEVATRRATDEGITNVEAHVCSADELPFADETFDGVSVRFGYMFFPDLADATAELVRVLRPGGRLCAAVWVDPGENPWTTVVMEAIAGELSLPAPDPDRPSMYRCAPSGMMRALYEAAGLTTVEECDVPVELVTGSPEEYWQMISEHVSLVSASLARLDSSARDRIRTRVVHEVARYVQHGEVRVPGLARVVVGTKG